MQPSNRVPTHPGEILREEFLVPLGQTQVALAEHLDIPLQRINDLVRLSPGSVRSVVPVCAAERSRLPHDNGVCNQLLILRHRPPYHRAIIPVRGAPGIATGALRGMRVLADRYVLTDDAPRCGGHAEVFRARDMKTESDVAVKLFSGGPYPSPYVQEAYQRELKALHELQHPGVVRVIDFGTDTDTNRRFIVLEWMPEDLLTHLAQRPVGGWDDFVTQYGRPILDALNFAYEREICHRDLKPQNVLVSADGEPRIADFGLAKFKQYHQPGLTVGDHVSVPYAPPADDPRRASPDARDVFGFAALTVRCLSGHDLRSYEELFAALDELDVPNEIAEILGSCITKETDRTPANVAVLLDRIQAVQRERERTWAPRPVVPVFLPPGVLGRLSDVFPGLAAEEVIGRVTQDLNENCAISYWPAPPGAPEQNPRPLLLLSREYRYKAVVDSRTTDHLVILRIYPSNPSAVEHFRETAWVPTLRFVHGRPRDSSEARATVAWLLSGLEDHLSALQMERQRKDRERIFTLASNLLAARQELQSALERPIEFTDAFVEGRRLRLRVEDPLDEDLVGQPRVIWRDDGTPIAGEVDSVSDRDLLLFLERSVDGAVPRRGRLIFDTRANRSALAKQKAALDAIRFGRSVRPDLASVLVDPSSATPPIETPIERFFQDDLDDYKKRATALALAAEDVLVVEGPPGTGKTRFITELVLQALERNPAARILLTSQTHVALDNALERIHKLSPDLRVVRIGHRDDPRVSTAVSELLLANQVDLWLRQVKIASDRFLSEWAGRMGLRRAEIDLGMASARFAAALERHAEIEASVAKGQGEVDRLRAELDAIEAARREDTRQDLRERLEQASESLADDRDELRRSTQQVRAARDDVLAIPEYGQELARLPVSELREWEASFLGGTDARITSRRVFELVEEWHLRFWRSADFHGALIADAAVVSGTCVGFGGARGIHQVDFDLCIVDEASKATVTELFVPLSRARKWVLVGDPRQLPPFVEDALRKPEALERFDLRPDELSLTLLEYLADALPEGCRISLLDQHRMVRAIGDLISNCFYDGRLRSVRDDSEGIWGLVVPGGRPVTWLTTTRFDRRHETRAGASYINLSEVREVEKILRRLAFAAKARNRQVSVAIMTGYAAQRAEIRKAIAATGDALNSLRIECNTVDAFQGREADVAIFSVTRSNSDRQFGFLREIRRLNVALSRGRDALIIVGDHQFVRGVPGPNPFQRVLEHIESHPDACALAEAMP